MLKRIYRKIAGSTNSKPITTPNRHLSVGNSVLLPGFSVDAPFIPPDKKNITIGDDCMFAAKIHFESDKGEVTIGNKVYIGSSHIICRSKIEFGNNIFVAWGCYFYDHDSHSLDYRERMKDIDRQLEDYRSGKSNFTASKNWDVVNTSPIRICDNVWIGFNAIILKGVTIGVGAIVGAGSVVTKDVDPWTIVAGNPAKVVKEIPKELRKS